MRKTLLVIKVDDAVDVVVVVATQGSFKLTTVPSIDNK